MTNNSMVPSHSPVFVYSFTSPFSRRPHTAAVTSSSPRPSNARQLPSMVKYRSSIVLPFSRDRVWNAMSDWTNLAAWDVNITKSELAPGQDSGNVGLGTTYDCAFSLNGKDIPVAYECIRYDVPNVAQFHGLATLFESKDSIECEHVSDQQTKLTAEFNLSFRGLLSPLSFLMNGKMQKIGPIIMKDIEKFVGKQLSKGETS